MLLERALKKADLRVVLVDLFLVVFREEGVRDIFGDLRALEALYQVDIDPDELLKLELDALGSELLLGLRLAQVELPRDATDIRVLYRGLPLLLERLQLLENLLPVLLGLNPTEQVLVDIRLRRVVPGLFLEALLLLLLLEILLRVEAQVLLVLLLQQHGGALLHVVHGARPRLPEKLLAVFVHL